MRFVSEGIEATGREEAVYWLGMATQESSPSPDGGAIPADGAQNQGMRAVAPGCGENRTSPLDHGAWRGRSRCRRLCPLTAD